MKNKRIKLRGFTLVEVMTSLVIMSILIAIASAVIIVSFNIFARNSVMRAAQNDGNNIYNFLYDRISCASALKISENADNINKEYSGDTDNLFPENSTSALNIASYYEVVNISRTGISAQRNSMSLSRKTVGEEVYIYGDEDNKNTLHGCDCVVSFYNHKDAKSITMEVTLKRDGEVMYTKKGIVPLLNYSAIGTDIQVGDKGPSRDEYGFEMDDAEEVVINNLAGDINIIYTYLE